MVRTVLRFMATYGEKYDVSDNRSKDQGERGGIGEKENKS
jgi:hypothetical protein